jgi:dihydrolipoamide dehydrogenase
VLDGERRVRGGDDVLEARRAVVLATGSAATIPRVEGLQDAVTWTTREATTAREVPGRLLVLGGGVAGVELADAWSRLGARVTVVEVADRVLAARSPSPPSRWPARWPSGASTVRTGVEAQRAERAGDEVRLTLQGGETLSGDELLVAAGRRARTKGLGLEALGLDGRRAGSDRRAPPRQRPRLAVRRRRLQRPRAAHPPGQVPRPDRRRPRARAPRRAARARRSALAAGRLHRAQVAAVGHTLGGAREAGLDVRCVEVGTNANAGGSFTGKGVKGTARLVVTSGAA